MNTVKILILFVFFTISKNIQANEIHYNLGDSKTKIGTFSGDINQESSIHLIIYKDRAKHNLYGIKNFFINKYENIIELEDVTFSESPKILSYHLSKDNLLTIMFNQNKTGKIVIVDFDIDQKKITNQQLIEIKSIDTTVRLPNKTILLKHDRNLLNIIEIINTSTINNTSPKIDISNFGQLNTIFKSSPDIVNTNEYVKLGSVKSNKAYFYDNQLFILDYNFKKGETKTIKIDFNNNSNIIFNKFNFPITEKIKDGNYFFYKKNLFYVLNNKEDLILNIVDFDSHKLITTYSIVKELNHSADILQILKKSAKKANKPTITVNTASNNNMIVNLSSVYINSYNYHHDWFWHQQMMQMHMMQQQMMNNNIPRFGPNPDFYTYVSTYNNDEKLCKLILNSNFEILTNSDKESVSIYQDIDKEKYIEDLKKNKSYKDATLSITSQSVRYIYYSKKEKVFIIKTSEL